MLIVSTRNRVEIAYKHPHLLTLRIMLENALLADMLHLSRPEYVATLLLGTLLLILSPVCIFERIGVDSDKVDDLAVHVNLSMTGTMHHDDIVAIAVDPVHDPDRIFRSDNLRECIPLADIHDIFMTVPARQKIPIVWKIHLLSRFHLHVCVRTVT